MGTKDAQSAAELQMADGGPSMGKRQASSGGSNPASFTVRYTDE